MLLAEYLQNYEEHVRSNDVKEGNFVIITVIIGLFAGQNEHFYQVKAYREKNHTVSVREVKNHKNKNEALKHEPHRKESDQASLLSVF